MESLPNEIILSIIKIILDICKFTDAISIRYINKNHNNLFMYAIKYYKDPIINLYKYNINNDNSLLHDVNNDYWIDIGREWMYGSHNIIIKYLRNADFSTIKRQEICKNFMDGMTASGLYPMMMEEFIELCKNYFRIRIYMPTIYQVFNNLDNMLYSRIDKSIMVSRYEDYKTYPRYYRYAVIQLQDNILLTKTFKKYPEKILSIVTSLNYGKVHDIGYNTFSNLLEYNIDVNKLEMAAIDNIEINYKDVYDYIMYGIKYKMNA